MKAEKIKVIIIEDSPTDREFYIAALTNYFAAHIEIVGICFDIDSAQQIILDQKPELWILDIELPGGTGFALLHRILDADPHYKFSVLFITAYKDRIMEALKYAGMQYAAKPISEFEFQRIINVLIQQILVNRENYLLRIEFETINQKYHNLLNQIKGKSIQIKMTGGEIRNIDLDSIDHISSDGHYTFFRLSQTKENILCNDCIGTFEDQLCQDHLFFFRIHNRHIIHKKHVSSIRKNAKTVLMKSNIELPIARRRWDEFLEFMELF